MSFRVTEYKEITFNEYLWLHNVPYFLTACSTVRPADGDYSALPFKVVSALLEKFKEKKPHVVQTLQEAIDAVFLTVRPTHPSCQLLCPF